MPGNPFTYGNPISGPRCFFGRQREVDQICGRLLNDAFESSSLVGDRRIGKTSLLNYIADPGVRAARGLGRQRQQPCRSIAGAVFVNVGGYLNFRAWHDTGSNLKLAATDNIPRIVIIWPGIM